MKPFRYIAAAVLWLLLGSFAIANDAEPTHYSPSELSIIRSRPVDGKLEVVFRTRPDTWFWCPGIKTEEIKEGIAVTFVRCPVKKDGVVDQKAERGKDYFKQTVRIDMKGRSVFIKDGKKLTPLHKVKAPPAKKKSTSKKRNKKK